MIKRDNTRISNEIKLLAFTAGLGAVAGAIIWIFAKLVGLCTALLWEKLPGAVNLTFLPVIVCAAGGLLIGLIHKKYGDYPEELTVVMGRIKREKHYAYDRMLPLLIAAFLPLVFAGSVGPEAGLTGIIAGLCYWVGDNVRFARERKQEYAQIGQAVTLGTIFHSPLFGVFAVEEDELIGAMRDHAASDVTAGFEQQKAASGAGLAQDAVIKGTRLDREHSMPRATKLALYALALSGAFLAFHLLSAAFGKASSGFPHFSEITVHWQDVLLLLIYIPVGILLCLLFALCEKYTGASAAKIPVIAREIAGGIVIGLIGIGVPMVLFSGEEQMGELARTFGSYTPLFLIGVCLLKLFLTAFSIKFGFKGGHFFPLIFACCCMGFALAMVFFPNTEMGHMVFAAGCVTSATLGAQIKKPVAVAMLTLLCFPVKMVLFLFLAAALGSWLAGKIKRHSHDC